MIFVTVGSTKFDLLIKKMDELIEEGSIEDEVIMQIGRGEYKPKKGDCFRFKPTLEKEYEGADIVICHEGAGTLLELVNLGKKTVCVPNPKTVNNPDIMEKLAKEEHIIKCNGVEQIKKCIEKARKKKFKKYKKPECSIGKEIKRFLGE